jgi:predicted DNA-binding protein
MSRKASESETMSQISLKLPKELIDKYNQYSKSKSNPRSYYMREALVEYIERKEKEK